MNYYEILEVSVNASKEVIKNAYRALSKKYHPDTFKGDKKYAEEKLKLINCAYETLIDEDKRLIYDYDNGFKIDPNAPIDDENGVVKAKHQEVKVEEKSEDDKFILFLKEKKVIVIIVITIAFVLAFIIGLWIAGKDSSSNEENTEKEEQTTNSSTDKVSTPSNNNYNYNYNEPIINKNDEKNNVIEQSPKEDELVENNNTNIENTNNSDNFGVS